MNTLDNSTANDSFSCYDPLIENGPSIVNYRYVSVTWGIIVTLVGTVGNILTILAYLLDKKLQTRFNLLIINLTLADLLYCGLLQPFSVDSYLHLYWRSGATFCRVFGMLLFVSNSVSILTLCLIAVSRYILIANSKLFDRVFTRLGMPLIIFVTWVIGFASFGPLWNVFVLVPKVCTCSFHRIRGRPYTTILMAFYFVIGLGCVGVFYLLIHRKVKAAAKALDQYKLKKPKAKSGYVAGTSASIPGKFQENDSGVDIEGSHANSSEVISEQVPSSKSQASQQSATSSKSSGSVAPSQPKDTSSEFKKVTRMCFVVFMFFVISYIPFLLLNIFDAKNRAPQVLHMIAANLTWLNSCINPILYAAMNRQFNQAYRNVLFICFRKPSRRT